MSQKRLLGGREKNSGHMTQKLKSISLTSLLPIWWGEGEEDNLSLLSEPQYVYL